MEYVILIPFHNVYDIKKFAIQNNIKHYNIMYLPARGKEYPKKFLIVIENTDKQFTFSTIGGFYFKELNELEKFKKTFLKNKTFIHWKLTNGDYILFNVDIDKPLGIHKY